MTLGAQYKIITEGTGSNDVSWDVTAPAASDWAAYGFDIYVTQVNRFILIT